LNVQDLTAVTLIHAKKNHLYELLLSSESKISKELTPTKAFFIEALFSLLLMFLVLLFIYFADCSFLDLKNMAKVTGAASHGTL
jgi:hypothetical protein